MKPQLPRFRLRRSACAAAVLLATLVPLRAAADDGGPAAAPAPAPVEDGVGQLVVKGRMRFFSGDLDGAEEAFRRACLAEPGNAEACEYLERIARKRAETAGLDQARTCGEMLNEVGRAWRRPGVFQEPAPGPQAAAPVLPLARKLDGIIIPLVSFSGMELAGAVHTLGVVAGEHDNTGLGERGLNIVLVDPSGPGPAVNITLRNLPLRRVLDFITEAAGYQYELQPDAVVVRPGGGNSSLSTEFFAVAHATVVRMTGLGAGDGAAPAAQGDPFAVPAAQVPAAAAPGGGEAAAMRAFLQQAGVNFDSVPGSSLAYDGSAMIVTQTARNLERVRTILNRYNDVRQVEIEARFMEVQEGALEELGIDWHAAARSGGKVCDAAGRTLSGAFTNLAASNRGRIVRPGLPSGAEDADGNPVLIAPLDLPLENLPPTFPGSVDLGGGAAPLAAVTEKVGEFDVGAILNALSRRSGTDLLSAPRVTVLSGNTATITVARELLYPTRYGDISSEVGRGGGDLSGGSAGVTVTAGTPQDFTTRKVGVELVVTPTVEEDDYSISLELNPRVTEFEGFVEYGGQSVAISGGTTVTMPSGFYQPVFSVREITTRVTLWDGATLVMGGLTREEIKKVADKVPVLGSLPVIGRLFRSEGRTAQKRNLLIFVTANLVSPGGSPKRQALRGVAPSSLFQNPVIMTPGGQAERAPGK